MGLHDSESSLKYHGVSLTIVSSQGGHQREKYRVVHHVQEDLSKTISTHFPKQRLEKLGNFIFEEDLDNLDHPCSLIKTHWAPIWFTCDLCSPGLAPEIIIKTETLGDDVKEVLKRLGMTTDSTDVMFPVVRMTGIDDQGQQISHPSEQRGDSGAYTVKYFSQLTRKQILDLYKVYRMDFLMFGYHADSFLELLSQDFNENLKNGNPKGV